MILIGFCRPNMQAGNKGLQPWHLVLWASLLFAIPNDVTQAAAVARPKNNTLSIQRVIACTNGPGVSQVINRRSLTFQLYLSPQGQVFDFDNGTYDRGVHYVPDGRLHPMTKQSVLDGIKVTSRGSARAAWNGNVLTLEETHVYQGILPSGVALENRISDLSVYDIDLSNRRCSTLKVGYHRSFTRNGIVVQDVSCAEIVDQSCRIRDGQ